MQEKLERLKLGSLTLRILRVQEDCLASNQPGTTRSMIMTLEIAH